MDAYRLPKASDVEKASRQDAIERAMRSATATPLDTMRACQQALRGAVTVAANGNRRTTSDVGVGVELLMAALRGARMNVDINLAALNDQEYVGRVRTEAGELERDAVADAETARRAIR